MQNQEITVEKKAELPETAQTSLSREVAKIINEINGLIPNEPEINKAINDAICGSIEGMYLVGRECEISARKADIDLKQKLLDGAANLYKLAADCIINHKYNVTDIILFSLARACENFVESNFPKYNLEVKPWLKGEQIKKIQNLYSNAENYNLKNICDKLIEFNNINLGYVDDPSFLFDRNYYAHPFQTHPLEREQKVNRDIKQKYDDEANDERYYADYN